MGEAHVRDTARRCTIMSLPSAARVAAAAAAGGAVSGTRRPRRRRRHSATDDETKQVKDDVKTDNSSAWMFGCGHLFGMLDRDQRTAKLHVVHQDAAAASHADRIGRPRFSLQRTAAPVDNHHRKVPGRTTAARPRSLHKNGRNRRHHHVQSWRTTALRIKHALAYVAYLSVFLLVIPGTWCAPAGRSAATSTASTMSGSEDHPKWINPCGYKTDNASVYDGTFSEASISDSELLTQIVSQAKTALSSAEKFKEDFAQKTFSQEFSKVHDAWKNDHYDWLPTVEQVPKGLNEPVPKEHLDALELNTSLLNSYTYLQQIAVGLEQVVKEEKAKRGPFAASFKSAEDNVILVLCEIQMTIVERNLTGPRNVQSSIMSAEFRNMDDTRTNIRNWLIFRDYMNLLEYVIEVFSYLHTKL